MKAITIQQPWASLLACQAKMFETRSWQTHYRGPIAIHASKSESKEVQSLMSSSRRRRRGQSEYAATIEGYLELAGLPEYKHLPRGCVVAVANLDNCIRIQSFVLATLLPKEMMLGDWRIGRFAWHFSQMRMLPKPVPAQGSLGLWTWHADAPELVADGT